MRQSRFRIFLSLFLLLIAIHAGAATLAPPAENEKPVADIERYFPDEVGLKWSYRGTVADKVQRVATYTNNAAVKGTAEKKGAKVKVFTETNQANEGPAESYFLRDPKGIFYYGAEPTTPLEKAIVPYRVIRFPITIHQTYSQIERSGVSFGRDLDNDGQDEMSDVSAQIVAVGLETISVPAGTFKDCLKLQGTMTLQITLSSSHKVVQMIDTTTNWFAPGVGLVKGIEKTEFPSVEGSNPGGTLITEELTEYSQEKLPAP